MSKLRKIDWNIFVTGGQYGQDQDGNDYYFEGDKYSCLLKGSNVTGVGASPDKAYARALANLPMDKLAGALFSEEKPNSEAEKSIIDLIAEYGEICAKGARARGWLNCSDLYRAGGDIANDKQMHREISDNSIKAGLLFQQIKDRLLTMENHLASVSALNKATDGLLKKYGVSIIRNNK